MDKRTVMAVILSMGVILAYQLFLLPKPAPPPASRPVSSVPAPAAREETPVPVLAPAPASAPAPDVAAILARQEAAVPGEVTVQTPRGVAVLSGRGGSLSSWRLSGHAGTDGAPLELAPGAGPGVIGAVRFPDAELTRRFAEGTYLLEEAVLPLGPGNPESTLTFRRADPSGIELTKRYTFHYASPLVGVAVEVRNLGGAPLSTPWWLTWGRAPGGPDEEKGNFYAGPLLAEPSGVKESALKKDGDRLPVPPGTRWVGITNRYFLAAFIPRETDLDMFVERRDLAGTPTYAAGAGPRAPHLAAGATAGVAGQLFLGPKSIEALRDAGQGLELALDFGWFGFVGKPLLSILKFFHRHLASWGVAIILLTLLVKLLLFPVTFTMYKSMRRMQALQPQVQALRKKFKDDTQALNREMMELYKSHQVNPMGGCLPMLIQIPVFFALYKVLTISIELRGSRFLHVTDLSAGETTLGQFLHALLPAFPAAILPLKVLVILMGVTMLIQQRLTPQMGDPRQAKMMMFLPLIFTAMFWNFSAGLVVYFLFSNILSIGEQLLIRRLAPIPATMVEKKGAK